MMMMSVVAPLASTPRLSSQTLVANANGKQSSVKTSSANTAQLGVLPPAPQALTHDVFTPSISLKLPEQTPSPSESATETATTKVEVNKTAETKSAATNSLKTTEEKNAKIATPAPPQETAPVKTTEADPNAAERIEKAKAIMSQTEVKFSAEKDPTKAKQLLNDTYSSLKALKLPKENLIVHAMQLDVWDAAIVNLLPPAPAEKTDAPANTPSNKAVTQTAAAKDSVSVATESGKQSPAKGDALPAKEVANNTNTSVNLLA
jgi:hypothetical protein